MNYESQTSEADLGLLKEPEELLLMRKMTKFPELMEDIAQSYQVHHLARYALELASQFHDFYEKHRVIQPALLSSRDGNSIERARLALCRAVAAVLKSGLGLMGVSAPERM